MCIVYHIDFAVYVQRTEYSKVPYKKTYLYNIKSNIFLIDLEILTFILLKTPHTMS